MKSIRVILLAAGEGTRLRPITNSLPKCLVPINNKPLLWYWLRNFKNYASINEVWINTHYLKVQVEKFLEKIKDDFPFKIEKFFEKTLLGTAGTIRTLSERFNDDQDLLLAYADNLTLFSVSEFIDAHMSRPFGAEITMMIFDTDDPSSCGIVELDPSGMVIKFHEKVMDPPGNLANAAVFLISPNALREIKKMDNAFDFSNDVIPNFLGRIYTWKNSIYHRDIGTPSSYSKANIEFLEIYKKWI